jgi:flagellar assembly protein FliH
MSSRPVAHDNGNGVEPFIYDPAIDRATDPEAGLSIPPDAHEETDGREFAQRLRQSREEGYAEAEKRLRAQYEKDLAGVRAGIDSAIGEFAGQRERYFARVEEEVVNLALSIAKKILHREAQIDPLLLVGLVHVALEKVGAGTVVRLRVSPSTIGMWEKHFQEQGAGGPAPELVADTSLAPDGCLLETEVGTTSIGLETHLKEIKQGFFDLLAQRPR